MKRGRTRWLIDTALPPSSSLPPPLSRLVPEGRVVSLDDPARDSPLVGQRQSTCFLGHGTRCRTRYFREATRYFQSAASSDTWAPERVLSLPPRPPLTTGNKPFLRGQANNGNGFSFKTIATTSPLLVAPLVP